MVAQRRGLSAPAFIAGAQEVHVAGVVYSQNWRQPVIGRFDIFGPARGVERGADAVNARRRLEDRLFRAALGDLERRVVLAMGCGIDDEHEVLPRFQV